MIRWTATAATTARQGDARSRSEAWQAATTAAVELAAETGGRVDLAVDPAVATLYPAADASGRFDPAATQAAAQRLLDDILSST